MHDIRAIRENPAAFDAALSRRGMEPQSPSILKIDEEGKKLSLGLKASCARFHFQWDFAPKIIF